MPSAKANNSRLDRLRNCFKANLIDALLITHPANVSYICKYNIADTYLLISADAKFLITDFRYIQEAKKNIKGFSILKTNGSSIFDCITDVVKKLKIKRFGFESKYLPFAEHAKLQECFKARAILIPIFDLVEQLRLVKDRDEIAKIRKACDITSQALIFVKGILKPGITELDVAAEINRFVRKKGSSGCSFDVIVASGRHSCLPHHQTSTKIIKKNEPILVDMGVDFCGYKSDLTRMFFLGKMPHKLKKVIDVVFAAKQKAQEALKPGVSIKKIDAAAREYIGDFGWAKNFGHSLGHGIGLEIHEGPAINRKTHSCLMPGMVFTIEPAVYFPDEFGVRLEDMVLITKKGYKVLNASIDNSM